ncbi:MAG: helix-turn-helix transcriptional regulator [Planctomycetes bacterium]|nr:helix-turn-helix transcriptional regulator [Planctomycetota bacterium]MBI3848301.1 helix-turn-helix transcriptional regulator [Planctomycetota bacterium]
MTDPINREVLLALWKIHILHHAAEQPVYGLWLIEELAEHGYRLSPGTLYPILQRMQKNGWLRSPTERQPKSRRHFRITTKGRRVLARLRGLIAELHDEVVLSSKRSRRKKTSKRMFS